MAMMRHPGETAWHLSQIRTGNKSTAVPVRVHEPPGPRTGWLVWAHGGSWHSGSARAWHHACAELATFAGVTVVSVDYRLAPTHRHPAATLDVLAVLSWTAERAGGVPVAVGGDSAGAKIAACAALAVRDRGDALAAQVLAYPPLDPLCRASSYHRDRDAFPQAAMLAAAWLDYRGGHPDSSSSLLSSPFEAADLSGVAPAVLVVGALDPVLDDVRDYRRRLAGAGVSVHYQEMPGTPHGAFLAPEPALRDLLGRGLATVLEGKHP
jgi:acetyl esterase